MPRCPAHALCRRIVPEVEIIVPPADCPDAPYPKRDRIPKDPGLFYRTYALRDATIAIRSRKCCVSLPRWRNFIVFGLDAEYTFPPTAYTHIVLYRKALLHTLKHKAILCACLMVISIAIPMTNNLAFAVASNETAHDLDLKNLTNPPSQIAVLEPSNETAHDPTFQNLTNGMPLLTDELDDIRLNSLIIIALAIVMSVASIVIMAWAIKEFIRDLRRLKKSHPLLRDMPKSLYIALASLLIVLPFSMVFLIIESKSILDVLPTIVALVTTIVLSMSSMWISQRYTTTNFQKMYKKLNGIAVALTNLKQGTVADKRNLNRLNSIDSALKNVDSELNSIHDILDKINKKLDKQGGS